MKRKFTRIVNNLKRFLDESVGADVIARKFEELENLWSDIEDKHDNYVSLACGENSDLQEAEDTWINEVESVFLDIQLRVLNRSKLQESMEARNKMKLAEGALKVEEIAFDSLINSLQGISIENVKSKTQLTDLKIEIKESHNRCQAKTARWLDF